MEYLTLFWVFFKIGLVSFGGGYGMIPMIQDEVIGRGWLTQEQLLNFIGISESTPGPLAVNIATFIGSSRAGILGALCATVGVVLPSFVIILLIAAFFKNFLKNRWVQGALVGVRGVIVGLICATGFWMALELFFFADTGEGSSFDWRATVIFSGLILMMIVAKKAFKKSVSPILLILVAAALGAVFYSF